MKIHFYSVQTSLEITEGWESEAANLPLDKQEQGVLEVLKAWQKKEPIRFQSSGTTGVPSTYTFTNEQLKWSVASSIKALKLTSENHFGLAMDIRFVGASLLVLRAAELNASLSLFPVQSVSTLTIPKEAKISHLSLVPFQVQMSLENDPESLIKLNKLSQLLLGGAGISESLITQLRSLNCEVVHSYGMTETLSHIALRRPLIEDWFSALEGVELTANEEGCLCIKTPTTGEWLCTNDVVVWDDRKRFKVIGRADNIINSGGLKISPEDLEVYIQQEINIETKNWFIGWVPDEILGQKIVLVCEGQLMPKEIFNRIQEVVKRYKVPQAYPRLQITVKSFERTENLKLNRQKTLYSVHNQ